MMERRSFLCWLVSGAAAWPLRGIRLQAQAAALSADSVMALRAMAPAVLPSELRAAGHDKVVNDFVQWLAAYRPGAERSWGYGDPRPTATVQIDPARYADQLRALEQRAQGRGGTLRTLPLAARHDLAIEALEESSVRELPGSPNGRHVVADLMSFFFNSGAAADLVYRARIGRGTCRGLAGSASRPAAMTVGD